VKQRSTCRWCKRPIQRWNDSLNFPWKSDFGLDNTDAGNPECEVAPNPDDGPMPGHDPGTAVVNRDGTVAYYPPLDYTGEPS
jgi:hypothetical protein